MGIEGRLVSVSGNTVSYEIAVKSLLDDNYHLLLDHVQVVAPLPVLHLDVQLVAQAVGLVLVDAGGEFCQNFDGLDHQWILSINPSKPELVPIVPCPFYPERV